MQTTLNSAIDSYLRMHSRSRGTRNEYHSTLRKWEQWGHGGPIEDLQRKDLRDFLDWVYQRAVEDQGTNPAGPPTRPANTCVPSFHGRGSKS